jgi:hypothetical protein
MGRDLHWFLRATAAFHKSRPIGTLLQSLGFHLAAAAAPIDSHQFPQFYIKLFFLDNLPFVKSVFAQRFTLVFVFCFGYFKFYNVTHRCFLY